MQRSSATTATGGPRRGATSYEVLRTVAGITYSTFRETCEKRGLIETNKSLDDALSDSVTFQMPAALRRLFTTILVFFEATNIRELWRNTRIHCLRIIKETILTQVLSNK